MVFGQRNKLTFFLVNTFRRASNVFKQITTQQPFATPSVGLLHVHDVFLITGTDGGFVFGFDFLSPALGGVLQYTAVVSLILD